MRSRTRQINGVYDTIYKDGRPQRIIGLSDINEVFVEGSYPGSNQCKHWRVLPPAGRFLWQESPEEFSSVTNLIEDLVDSRAVSFINESRAYLSWDKLPTSSKFGIIQILAELDESILVFTRKFWTSLTYGSFTWGVLPLISDINSILDTCRRVFTTLDEMVPYKDTIDYSLSLPVAGLGTQAFDLKVTIRYSGKVMFSFGDIPAALDLLGFHPDIATAWDLVPLSFVLDYFIPIGNFLDGISRNGWVSRCYFDGWRTTRVDALYSYYERSRSSPHFWVYPSGIKNISKVDFQRIRISDSVSVEREIKDFDLELPSLTQLFNTFYVLVLSRRGL